MKGLYSLLILSYHKKLTKFNWKKIDEIIINCTKYNLEKLEKLC